MNRIVMIEVSGGVVQNVDVPEGIRVVVRDYDVDDDDNDLPVDEEGDKFLDAIWEADGDKQTLPPVDVLATVSGGVVQHVLVPEGIRVVVRDYDVESYDLNKKEDFFERIWEYNET